MPGIIIDKSYCKGCELCVKACPMQILSMSKELTKRGYFSAQVHDASRCIGCQICALVCPDSAITVVTHGQRYVLYDY
jgi:2-oxoglutarate ferredoxin oxidoreductase subunit delta